MLFGWIPFLLFYTVWLMRRRPHRRYVSHWSRTLGRKLVVDRWKCRMVEPPHLMGPLR